YNRRLARTIASTRDPEVTPFDTGDRETGGRTDHRPPGGEPTASPRAAPRSTGEQRGGPAQGDRRSASCAPVASPGRATMLGVARPVPERASWVRRGPGAAGPTGRGRSRVRPAGPSPDADRCMKAVPWPPNDGG